MKKPVELIFELSKSGRKAYSLPACDVPEAGEKIPEKFARKIDARLPEVFEVDVVRHFTRLSQLNYAVDLGFYPLGSCTMKYNPKINEAVSRLPGFLRLHPYQPDETVQGALKLMYDLEKMLCEITGMDRATLQPAAGAHGEMTGLMIIKAALEQRGEGKRKKIIIPDSAHGTNPASASMVGFEVLEVKSDERGNVDVEDLKKLMSDEVAGIMLTNPNTLGLFEERITEIARIIHDAGGLLYYDGANLNANLGKARPGDMGFDVVHLNLHKTFSTPHGGGGPGSGPIAVTKELVPFLPVPTVEKEGERYYLDYDKPLSIGKVRSFYGNFNVMVKAYAYILTMGPEGLREVAECSVLNANYLLKKLRDYFELPFDRWCKHEFVISGNRQKKATGVTTLDMVKRLIDYGFHPPTVYFPLIVPEAMMVEPTETESVETLDAFAETMISIAREAEEDPDLVKESPKNTPVTRLDEVTAAKRPVVKWDFEA